MQHVYDMGGGGGIFLFAKLNHAVGAEIILNYIYLLLLQSIALY